MDDLKETVSLSDDIIVCPAIISKIRQDYGYAQNLYAALCNIIWYKETEFLPMLKGDNEWSCSWRWAGGFVAGLGARNEDYMDFYCSGMRGDDDLDNRARDPNARPSVSEGTVTEEIENDLKQLGWKWKEYEDQGI